MPDTGRRRDGRTGPAGRGQRKQQSVGVLSGVGEGHARSVSERQLAGYWTSFFA